MRAVGFTEFGGPEVLRIVSRPDPSPGPGQVRVRVAAAAVNPTDLGFRAGGHGAMPRGLEPPYVPGMDLAGVVDLAGPGVDEWAAGDRVMAAVSPWGPGGGAQAEFVVVATDALARVPEGIGLEAAASMPMNALTVRAALDELALAPGQTLAVTGAAGAAGGDAIQLMTVRPFTGETERGIEVSLVLVFNHLQEGETLARLAELAVKGVLTLRVADVLPASQAAEAHRRFEAGGVRGRLVLTF